MEMGSPGPLAHQVDATSTWMVADIGGTHARLALASIVQGYGRLQHGSIRRYEVADWTGLEAIVSDFMACQKLPQPLAGFLCATAGYLQDGAVIHRNLPWPVSCRGLQSVCGEVPVRLVNDFAAFAHATLTLDETDRQSWLVPAGADPVSGGTVVILGPGTGLGGAILTQGRNGPQILPAEVGQVALAPGSARELQIFEYLSRRQAYVPVEQILSGPGLLATYQTLCHLEGRPPAASLPAEVSALALAGTDPLAVETLDIFCGQLGSVAADLAMLTGAGGGIYIGGSLVTVLARWLPDSSFSQRFYNKGVMRAFLQRVPVWGLAATDCGLRGAAVMAALPMAFAD